MGVVLGINGDNTAAGWTTFTVSANGSGEGSGYSGTGTRLIYVAAAPDGNDANTGTSAAPKLTLTAAQALLRPGKPDWLLLRKGDTWLDQELPLNYPVGANGAGVDAQNPWVIASYDPANPTVPNPGTGGARPLIKTEPNQGGITSSGGSAAVMSYLAIVGLEFYSYTRDPNFTATFAVSNGNSGFSFSNSHDFLLIEDCKFTYFGTSILDIAQPGYVGNNLYFRRSNVSFHWQWTSRSNGIHMSQWNTPVIADSFFDHNGYSEVLSAQTSVTITGTVGTPIVVTWPTNLCPPSGGNIVFASTGGNITAGTAENTVIHSGVGYIVTNKSGNTFNISTDGVTPINRAGGEVTPQNCMWYDVQSNNGNHNIYYSPPVLSNKPLITGVMSARPSFCGIQLRPGGDVTNCAFIGCVGNFSGGMYNGLSSSVTRVVVVEGVPQGTGTGTTGYQIIQGTGTMTDTIVAHGTIVISDAMDVGNGSTHPEDDIITISVPGGVLSQATVQELSWFDGMSFYFFNTGSDTLPTPLAFGSANIYYSVNSSGDGVSCNIAATHAGSPITTSGTDAGSHQVITPGINCIIRNNIIYDWGSNSIGDDGVGDTIGPNDIGGAGPHFGTFPYPDPTRSTSTYAASLGISPATQDGFLTAMGNQSKDNWTAAKTTQAFVTYIRQGFGLDGGDAPPTPTPKQHGKGHIHHNVAWKPVR